MAFPEFNGYTYTATAVVTAFLLMESLSIDEQENFSAWLMIIGDMLNTNVVYETYLQDKANQGDSSNSDEHKELSKIVEDLQKEISSLKQQMLKKEGNFD